MFITQNHSQDVQSHFPSDKVGLTCHDPNITMAFLVSTSPKWPSSVPPDRLYLTHWISPLQRILPGLLHWNFMPVIFVCHSTYISVLQHLLHYIIIWFAFFLHLFLKLHCNFQRQRGHHSTALHGAQHQFKHVFSKSCFQPLWRGALTEESVLLHSKLELEPNGFSFALYIG